MLGSEFFKEICTHLTQQGKKEKMWEIASEQGRALWTERKKGDSG